MKQGISHTSKKCSTHNKYKSCVFNNTVRFRRWSRKAYAAFSSIHKQVSIGHVCKGIADSAVIKSSNSHLSVFRTVFKSHQYEPLSTDYDISAYTWIGNIGNIADRTTFLANIVSACNLKLRCCRLKAGIGYICNTLACTYSISEIILYFYLYKFIYYRYNNRTG